MLSSLRDVCRDGKGKVYVVDAAGFFAGIQLRISNGIAVTAKSVLNEVKDLNSKKMLEYALEAGKVIVLEPLKDYKEHVIKTAKKLGEAGKLSKADIDILTLTYQALRSGCNVVVVTDDKSVQNVALALGAKILGIKYRALKKPRRHVYVCPICGYVSNEPGLCPRCGVKLVRKVLR